MVKLQSTPVSKKIIKISALIYIALLYGNCVLFLLLLNLVASFGGYATVVAHHRQGT